MSLQTAIQEIKTSQLQPIYLVLGTEKFLQEQVRQAFLSRFAVSKDDLNFAQFDLEKDSLELVIQEAESMPFFGDQRLIFMERPFVLTAEKKSSVPEQNLDVLINYIKDPVTTSVLVIFAEYEKLDERKKVSKLLKKNAAVINVQPMKEQDVRRYLQQTLSVEEIDMDRQAFELFLRLTDLNLSKAMNELEKLRLYSGGKQKITTTVLEALIPKTLEHNVFDLTNDVLQGKVEEALRLYDDLLLQGEETIKINAILIAQIRLLLQTKVLAKIGYQQANIAETLNIHPYRVKLALQQCRQFKEKQLANLYNELIENDYLIKSGQMEKTSLFQLFVLKSNPKVH